RTNIPQHDDQTHKNAATPKGSRRFFVTKARSQIQKDGHVLRPFDFFRMELTLPLGLNPG
ncbi:hypothetical protein, partial [Rhodopseudomonas pseudopalustris]|uniref:hypothetical protein n=1 Tax=Rhodopseudomonas pseudopalustris TaxID=1513892 RepID=UPI001AECBC88